MRPKWGFDVERCGGRRVASWSRPFVRYALHAASRWSEGHRARNSGHLVPDAETATPSLVAAGVAVGQRLFHCVSGGCLQPRAGVANS